MRQPINWRTLSTGGFAVVLTIALSIAAGMPAHAQNYQVIYTFAGHESSSHPIAGVTLDRRGNIFGTTTWGGTEAPGTVYELKNSGSGYVYSDLHDFQNGTDGNFPWATPTIGPNGSLYGTTYTGGVDGDGTVFNVQPPPNICRAVSCPWDESLLYSFTRGMDGGNPQGGLIFDSHGNMYGTNVNGGDGFGVVFEMTPAGSGWNYEALYTFTGGSDGGSPGSTLAFDSAGNLYGTAMSGGIQGCAGDLGCGTVFELSPSGSGWTETTLYEFRNGSDGADPEGGLVIDGIGNLYGATIGSDSAPGGTVYELSPSGESWTFTRLCQIPGAGPGPESTMVRDSAGNLYASTWGDGVYADGNVFKVAPTNHGWVYTSIHDFTNGSDGSGAIGGMFIDGSGNIFGTTYGGGLGYGVVFEITP
jgi:uncharacterized repeat protein (TIGR03803 family)